MERDERSADHDAVVEQLRQNFAALTSNSTGSGEVELETEIARRSKRSGGMGDYRNPG